ncbi:MAG: EamA family transporter [Methylobacterium sp.]|nr:EamA family transporter [Methylobacterium sp.]
MAARDLVLVLMLVILWGSTFTAMKIGVVDLPPLLINTLRFALSAFPAILFIPHPKVPLWTLVSFGLILFGVKFTVLFAALKLGLPAGLASIVLQMQVFFTIFFAFLILGERPSRLSLIGAGMALIGMLIFAEEKIEKAALVPFLLALLAATLWGFANIIVKKAKAPDILSFVVWASAVATPVLFAASLIVDGPQRVFSILAAPGWTTILVTLYLSFGATLFGYSVWNGLISRYPVAKVGPFALLIPVSGLACGAIFLGETFSVQAMIASAIVFLGLMINVFGDRIVTRMRG